jgi:hypothetical protein
MNITPSIRKVWKSAELLIAFHKNKQNERRDSAYLWRPKDGIARLFGPPEDQETVVVLKGEDDHEDVQVKISPDKVVVRRDQVLGWSGVIIDDDQARVKVDNVEITISLDGSVKVVNDAETTYLEGDGSLIKITPDSEILVAGDGKSLSRRTQHQIDAITDQGFLSKRRST